MKNGILVLSFLASITLVGASWAEDDHAMHGKGGACKKDVEKFCKDVEPGEGRIIKCLKEHESDLSGECKAKQKAMKEKFKEKQEACKADVEKFCKDVKPGEGRIIKCLKEHESNLSSECEGTFEHKGPKGKKHEHKADET